MEALLIKYLRNSFLLLLLFASSFSGKSQIIINEFLASNASVVLDPDYGRYSDFIEIKNNSDIPINLSNYSITDSPNERNKRKWIFPEIVLNPNDYLILWADGKDKFFGDTAYNEILKENINITQLHLNFKLSSFGEYIGLFDIDGNKLDEINFGNQLSDISYGRNPANPADWQYFVDVTASMENSYYGAPELIFAPEPIFSIDQGFYQPGMCVLDITTDIENAHIRFTDNEGKIPDHNSKLFEGDTLLDRTTTIRARVYVEGMLPGPIITKTYFVNQTISMPVVSISTDADLLWSMPYGIFRTHNEGIKLHEIPASIEYFDKDNNFAFAKNGAIQLFGSTIFSLPQKPISVRFSGKFDSEPLVYKLFDDRDNIYFNSFQLRNGGNDYNNAFFRDGLAVELIKSNMDVDYQEYQPCVVYINGEYWGIYEIRERLNQDYIGSNHILNSENLDILEDSLTIVRGESESFAELINFIVENDLSQNQNYEYVKSQIDIDEYINFMIHRIFIGYVILEHNTKYWREKTENGKWRWILSDMEHAFGPQLSGHNYWDNTLAITTGSAGELPEWTNVLFKNLIKNYGFRSEFTQRFAVYLNTIYKPEITIAITDSLRNALSTQMPRHIAKWGTPNSMSFWNNNVNFIKTFLLNRPKNVRMHLSQEFFVEDSAKMNLNIIGGGKISISGVWLNSNSEDYYFKNLQTNIIAEPDFGYKFSHWIGIDDNNPQTSIILIHDTIISAVFEPIQESIIPALIISDTILSAELSPWYGIEDIYVNEGAKLSFEAGTLVLMSDNVSIYVMGQLNIDGEENNPVLIMSDTTLRARKPIYNTNPRWGIICLENAQDTAKITNSEIKDCGYGKEREKMFAAITSYNSKIQIKNSIIQDNIQPFYSEYGHVYIGYSNFRSKLVCDLINVKYSDNAIVEFCDLKGDIATDTDAIDFDSITNGIIRNNKIYGFNASNCDGIDLGEASKNIIIENNIIYNVSDKGISIGQASTAIIKNNVIFGSDIGIAIKDTESFAFADRNTIAYCRIGVACYEKNAGKGGGFADIENTIIAYSSENDIFFDNLSGIEIAYSLSNTSNMTGLSNLNQEPLFVNAEISNFELRSQSPCIDAGNPDSPTDPDGTVADIGAKYTHSNSNIVSVLITEIQYNPASNYDSGIWIEIKNTTDSVINLYNWSISGLADHIVITKDILINPNEKIVICQNFENFILLHPELAQTKIVEIKKLLLNEKSGQIRLMDSNHNLIHQTWYTDTWPHPPLANGKGATIELEIDEDDNNLFIWRESYILSGTPGEENSIKPDFSNIYINEFMTLGNNILKDEYHEYDDWIEIFNNNDYPVNISGLYLSDNLENPNKYQIPLNQPDSTVIPEYGFLIIWADNQSFQGILHTSFGINSAGEQIGIFQRSKNEIVKIDEISFNMQEEEISYGRFLDGTDNWIYMPPSPSAKNKEFKLPKDPTKRINVFPNPACELVNIVTINYDEEYSISIIDISGKTIAKYNEQSYTQITIKTDHISDGLYFIKLVFASGETHIEKIIIE